MTDEQMNVAIAEHCGWRRPSHKDCKKAKKNMVIGDSWWLNPNGDLEHPRHIPNYCGDLNAMHEAEKMLNKGQHWYYINELTVLTEAEWTACLDEVFVVAAATARQRAEAFLKTVNKWEDEQ